MCICFCCRRKDYKKCLQKKEKKEKEKENKKEKEKNVFDLCFLD